MYVLTFISSFNNVKCLLICDFQVLILQIVKKFTIPTGTTVNKCFQSLTHGLSDQGVCERLCSA